MTIGLVGPEIPSREAELSDQYARGAAEVLAQLPARDRDRALQRALCFEPIEEAQEILVGRARAAERHWLAEQQRIRAAVQRDLAALGERDLADAERTGRGRRDRMRAV